MIFGFSTFALNTLLVKNLLQNLKQRRRLRSRDEEDAPAILPGLTLAIPVRNDEKNLRAMLPGLKNQDSLPERILFLDESTRDRGESLLRAFRAEVSRVPVDVVSGDPKPSGYGQKVWALEQLASHVTTPFVLFMEPHVRLSHPHSLYSLYQECEKIRRGENSFASVFPRPRTSVPSALLVNQIFMHLYYLLPAGNSGGKKISAGCGQIMFINVEKLRAYKFLPLIAHSELQGLQLARSFAEKEGDVGLYDGGALFHSSYFPSLAAAAKDFARSAFDADASIATTAFVSAILFWAFVLPFILLPFAVLNPWWLAALLVIIWGQYRLYQELDLHPSLIIMTPLSALLTSLLHIWSAVEKNARPLLQSPT